MPRIIDGFGGVVGALAGLLTGGGGGGARITDSQGNTYDSRSSLYAAMLNRLAAAATPPAVQPTPDPLPPLPQSPPPDVPLPPIAPPVGPSAAPELLPLSQPSLGAFGPTGFGFGAGDFDEAYGRGRSRLKLRKARRIARRRGTMTAQTIPPNRMPVPEAYRNIPPAIDEEARPLQRSRTREPGARRRVGVGVGAMIDPIDIAEALGQGAGAIVGEMIESGDPELDRQFAENERELRRRQAEHERQYERLESGQIDMENAIPGRIRSIDDLYSGSTPSGALERFPETPGRMRPFPKMPAPPPAAPRRRGQRILQRVQSMTSNRYAQLGVLGLGILGGRRSARSGAGAAALLPMAPIPETPLEAIPTPLTPNNDALLPYWSPVTGMSPASSAKARCDCKPKKRGPRRRCLARAPVKWAGGPKKGKSAGKRCIRWEN